MELDKSADTGEFICVVGRGCHGGGHERRHSYGEKEVVRKVSVRGSGV